MDDVKPTYVGATGALLAACKATFEWNSEEPVVVIIWHEGWMQADLNFWDTLHETLTAQTAIRLLVTFFGDVPQDFAEKESGDPLLHLLQAISSDTRNAVGNPSGWASLTDFERLYSASLIWTKTADSALIRLSKVCSAIASSMEPPAERRKYPQVTLPEFFLFLSDPRQSRAINLHNAKNSEEGRNGLRLLKWLASYALVPRATPLKILLVENKPGDFASQPPSKDQPVDRDLGSINAAIARSLEKFAFSTSPLSFFSQAKIYLVKRDFDKLRFEQGRKDFIVKVWNSDEGRDGGKPEKIPWDDLDLVLQDIVLKDEDAQLTGLELVSHYFEACPQALVFLLTSLDIESLVGSGDVNDRYVDCTVSKSAMETLWYEYRRCFQERYGRMFWPDWASATDDERKLLRNLFGSLRKWQIEPDILWHGQTLPEMIDHAHRHITALWDLTNDFVGTLLENGGADMKVLALRHRVSLALAVWMHDVGHRGDEYMAEPMDIRSNHAGISERLLLRNPDAYGLGWLVEEHRPARKPRAGSKEEINRDARLEARNSKLCSHEQDDTELCLLRQVGLLCRHHQSNAPLDGGSTIRMAARGKSPSYYSLIPDPDDGSINGERFLRGMIDPSCPMPSPRGTRVRTLDDFELSDKSAFRSLVGLLRILDALQLHRARVGSAASIASFIEFLDNRFHWCGNERDRLEEAMRKALPGTRAFQRAIGDLDALAEYEILLSTQQVHFWRQAAVHEVVTHWEWQTGGKACVGITYRMNARGLSTLEKLVTSLPKSDGTLKEVFISRILKSATGMDRLQIDPDELREPFAKWICNVLEEVITPEHNSQYPPDKSNAGGYGGAVAPHVTLRVAVDGIEEHIFDAPHVLHEQNGGT